MTPGPPDKGLKARFDALLVKLADSAKLCQPQTKLRWKHAKGTIHAWNRLQRNAAKFALHMQHMLHMQTFKNACAKDRCA